MYLPQNIKYLRKLKFDCTQEELGAKVGKSKYDISNYETGKTPPSIDTVIKFCELFEIDLDALVFKDLKSESTIVQDPPGEYKKIDVVEELNDLRKRMEELERRVGGE